MRFPSELLSEVKRRLLSAPAEFTWQKWHLGREGEPRCVIGHVQGVASLPGFADEAEWELDKEAKLINPSCDGARDINDLGRTSLWGVIAMLGRTIRRLEAEGR